MGARLDALGAGPKTGQLQLLRSRKDPEKAASLPWHTEEGWDLAGALASATEAPLVLASACRDRLFQTAVFRTVSGPSGGAAPTPQARRVPTGS